MTETSNEVTANHAKEVCKQGQESAQCKYLVVSKGYCCGKAWPSDIRKHLESRGRIAKGDNCSGPPAYTPGLKS